MARASKAPPRPDRVQLDECAQSALATAWQDSAGGSERKGKIPKHSPASLEITRNICRFAFFESNFCESHHRIDSCLSNEIKFFPAIRIACCAVALGIEIDLVRSTQLKNRSKFECTCFVVSRITDPTSVLSEYPAARRKPPRRRQRDFFL
jgi:hypothetical protein